MATIRDPDHPAHPDGGASSVEADGTTVGECWPSSTRAHPGFKDRLFDDQGALAASSTSSWPTTTSATFQGVDTSVADGAEIRSSRRCRGRRQARRRLAVDDDDLFAMSLTASPPSTIRCRRH